MPAPPGPMMKSQVVAKMGPKTTASPAFVKFITALTAEISKQWGMWILGSKFGGIAVTGAGIGAFVGVGVGGKITAPKIMFDPDAVLAAAGFEKKMPPTIKLITELSNATSAKFDSWASSYKFAGLAFAGASTATPLTPGVFNAVNVPTPLLAAGVGVPPSGIQAAWESALAPDFKLDNEFCSTKVFTKAVASTIEELFAQFFLANTLGLGNSVIGPATPGPGAGVGSSLNDGKLV